MLSPRFALLLLCIDLVCWQCSANILPARGVSRSEVRQNPLTDKHDRVLLLGDAAPSKRKEGNSAMDTKPPPLAVFAPIAQHVLGGLLRLSPLGLAALLILQSEQARRSLFFWTNAVPIYVHYKAVDKMLEGRPKKVRREAFERLHTKYANRVYDVIVHLGGFYLKFGQIGATREDFVPKQWTVLLERLEDKVPPEKDPHYPPLLVEKELKRPLHEVFDGFEVEPMGSASIGQCHRAILKDRRKVVVKVMRPHAKRLFEGDLSTLEQFCKFAQPQISPVFEEFRHQFKSEFDYRREAENLQLVWSKLKGKWSGRVVIPQPISELVTQDVLVMEYVPGKKLVDVLKEQARREAAKRGVKVEDLQREHMEMLRRRQNNIFTSLGDIQQSVMIKVHNFVVRVGDFMRRSSQQLSSVCMSDVKQKPFEWTELPVDPDTTISRVVEVHGDQLFEHGCLNCDPHPGNILLMPDGRLGLIDFGQVKKLSLEERILYARLIVALAEKDSFEIVRAYKEMGVRTRHNTPHVLQAWATILNDRDDDSVLEGQNFQGYMEELNRRDPLIHAPDTFVLVQRASVLLRGCAIVLGRKLSMAERWKKHATRLLTRYRRHVEELGMACVTATPKCVVICGPSGVGKGTLINMLLKDKGCGRLGFSVSHTTRKPRPGEVDGVHYNFITHEVMEKLLKKSKFLEHARVHGNIYGTSFEAVEKVICDGKICILDIDVQGVRACRRSKLEAAYVFIAPPSIAELERRLTGRGTESEEQVTKRLRNAIGELQDSHQPGLFDFVIVNDDLQKAFRQLKMIITGQVSN